MTDKTKTTTFTKEEMLEWLDSFRESGEPAPDERSIEVAKAVRQLLTKGEP